VKWRQRSGMAALAYGVTAKITIGGENRGGAIENKSINESMASAMWRKSNGNIGSYQRL